MTVGRKAGRRQIGRQKVSQLGRHAGRNEGVRKGK
jgi:hypothetical protein